MSGSNVFETAVMALIFLGDAWSGWAQNDLTAAEGFIAVGLCKNDPGEAGIMSTNESTYTGYARVDTTRDFNAWAVQGGNVNPVVPLVFPTSTGSESESELVSYFTIGQSGVPGGDMLFYGEVSPNVSITRGRTPRLGVATTISLE